MSISQHIQKMRQLRLAISVNVIKTIIDDPIGDGVINMGVVVDPQNFVIPPEPYWDVPDLPLQDAPTVNK